MLAHLTGRTLVFPDHLAADNLFMMRPPVSLWDFYDFEHLRQWIDAISMNQYLTDRRATDARNGMAVAVIPRAGRLQPGNNEACLFARLGPHLDSGCLAVCRALHQPCLSLALPQERGRRRPRAQGRQRVARLPA